jgi:hypothetical protein
MAADGCLDREDALARSYGCIMRCYACDRRMFKKMGACVVAYCMAAHGQCRCEGVYVAKTPTVWEFLKETEGMDL